MTEADTTYWVMQLPEPWRGNVVYNLGIHKVTMSFIVVEPGIQLHECASIMCQTIGVGQQMILQSQIWCAGQISEVLDRMGIEHVNPFPDDSAIDCKEA